MNQLVEKKYLITFILITSLFALWGFANDITNPMVAAFQTLMELSAFEASSPDLLIPLCRLLFSASFSFCLYAVVLLMDAPEHVLQHMGEGRCGSGWRRLPSAQAFVGSPPSPVPHLCSCSEGDSWADYCGRAGLSVAGVSRTPRMTV